MTDNEFQIEKSKIDIDYKNKLNALYKTYALSNNPYKIGDIIRDHYHTIRITKIKYTVYNKAECVYFGIPLRKDLIPKKRFVDSEKYMYQRNVKEKIN